MIEGMRAATSFSLVWMHCRRCQVFVGNLFAPFAKIGAQKSATAGVGGLINSTVHVHSVVLSASFTSSLATASIVASNISLTGSTISGQVTFEFGAAGEGVARGSRVFIAGNQLDTAKTNPLVINAIKLNNSVLHIAENFIVAGSTYPAAGVNLVGTTHGASDVILDGNTITGNTAVCVSAAPTVSGPRLMSTLLICEK